MQAGSSVEDMTVFCQTDIEDVIFDIIVTQFKEKDKIIIPFTLNVKRLSGKMNVECCPEDLTFIARYSEAPQVQLSTETVNNSIAAQEDYQALCDLVCEITTEALLSSIINLRFTCYPECPRLSIKLSASDKVCEAEENESGEQLLVKIIKATNIGGDKGCLKPYCVVEMDEPPQKYETRDVEEKSNPFWDESFIFTVKDVSAELLFEVYDKGKSSNENFLGLGIVSVEELIKNPSQRQIIPLQSRPMEKDDVTGSLTTEFLFLNQITPVSEPTYLAQHNGIGDGVHGPGKTVETNSRVTAGGTVITTTTIKRTNQETCGRPEATSNEIANSISNNSAGPILTSVHEVAEEQNHKMNFAINEQAVVSDANKMNGDPKMHKSIIENNHLNENLNEVESALKNVSTCINDKIEGLTLNTVCETKENNEFGKMSLNSEKQCSFLNGVPDLECNTVHVHAPPNTPVILVGDFLPKTDENCSLPIKIEENGIIGATELHDISETVENSMSFSRDTDSSSIELCSTLPPIAEQVEISSSSSKGLENYNGEHFFHYLKLQEL
ncbi:C2 domain-containing protein 2, partial [Stegodyphus mimosarum]